jgi:hypothetical protein
MALDDVQVTPLDPERFRDVLSPDGLAAFERAIARGHELLESRTFWEGLDEAKLSVIAPSIDSFAPKNHVMSFTAPATSSSRPIWSSSAIA